MSEQARSLHGLGTVYQAIGERERAAVFLERALVLRRGLADSDPRGLQTSLLQVGELHRDSGAVRAAVDLHLEALDRALTMRQRARALLAIGLDHEANGALPAAMQAYESALQLDVPRDTPVGAALLGAYGRVRMRAGDESGRELILQAAQLQEASGNQDLAAAEYLALSQNDSRTGNLDSALANVHKALSRYESQRLRTVTPDLRGIYVANRAAAFELQSELLMRAAERAVEAGEKQGYRDLALLAYDTKRRRLLDDFRDLAGPGPGAESGPETATALVVCDGQIVAKRHRLATVMEQTNPSPTQIELLRRDISLLRTRLDLAQATASRTRERGRPVTAAPGSVRDILETLEPDTALLAYQLGEERSWLWYATRTSMSVSRAARPRGSAARSARSLHLLEHARVYAGRYSPRTGPERADSGLRA